MTRALELGVIVECLIMGCRSRLAWRAKTWKSPACWCPRMPQSR